MKDSIEARIKAIREAEELADLKKHLCPFFEKGGYEGCITCKRAESDLDECRDYYLERIVLKPMDLWCEDFDKFVVQNRDLVSVHDVVGIGTNCESCYMSDKCPLFKKGYVCGIDWGNNRPKTPAEFVDWLLNTQFERVKRASVFEKVDGGVPDANLSSEMDRLTGLINMKENMGRDRLSINVEASGAAQQGGGILARLFGGGGSSQPAVESKETKALPVEEAEYVEEVIEKEPVKVKILRK